MTGPAKRNGPATTIGGFFGLELPTVRGSLPPGDAMLFHSGRACLRAVLQATQPKRFLAPFYVCDAALAPARAVGIPILHYGLDESLRPLVPEMVDGDLLMLVDYFGLCADLIRPLASCGGNVILDQTQALFAAGPAGCWRFTSARKWFGVPDGGFLWGPQALPTPDADALTSLPPHLLERVWGDPARAYQAFQIAEAGFDGEQMCISAASVALLRGVDVTRVKEARRRNFLQLQHRLDRHNSLRLPLSGEAIPFCYPLLPRGEVSRESLAGQGIFVPTFWADCLKRGQDVFAWEVDLCRRLLPLPIDHRYTAQDMERVADQVLRLINE